MSPVGVEPWTFYFVNGFLNFNVVFLLALLAIPCIEAVVSHSVSVYSCYYSWVVGQGKSASSIVITAGLGQDRTASSYLLHLG